MNRFGAVVGAAMVLSVSCGSATNEPPSVSATLTPNPYVLGSEGTVRVAATAADGTVGRGTVKVTSTGGSLSGGVDVELDRYGTATLPFICDDCTDEIEISARWIAADGQVARSTSITSLMVATSVRCDLGSVVNTANSGTLDLFGSPVFFLGGAALPAGRYRVQNTGGCMKYGAGQKWMSHAWADGSSAWFLIRDSVDHKLFMPPGVYGWKVVNGAPVDQGTETFAPCDAANRGTGAKEFDFEGGKLGLMLVDQRYDDNTPGENGRNPSWSLRRVTSDCP